MPDICMCPGIDCPHRNVCFRYRAKPEMHWQSHCTQNLCDNDEYHCYLNIVRCEPRIVSVEEVEDRCRRIEMQRTKEQNEALDELVKQAQELDMGY